jgi:hypothetical protein
MTNHRRRTFMPPLETRFKWTPKGREWRFGLKDAIIVDRRNQPNLTPGIMKSNLWSSSEKLRDRLHDNLDAAKKRFRKNPSIRTHNDVGKATDALENTLRRINEMFNFQNLNKKSGAMYKTNRSPQYSIANISDRYQLGSGQPYQYASNLRRAGQSIYRTDRTPQYSFSNIHERYQPRTQQFDRYGSALGHLGHSLHQTHRTPT